MYYTAYLMEWLLHPVVAKHLHITLTEATRTALVAEANMLHENRHPNLLDVCLFLLLFCAYVRTCACN